MNNGWDPENSDNSCSGKKKFLSLNLKSYLYAMIIGP